MKFDLSAAVSFEPLDGADGKSGASMERALLADGSRLVVKTIDPSQDWIMQATADPGRVVRLFDQGIFSEMPHGVDAALLDAEPLEGGGVRIIMPDVSHALFSERQLLTRAEGRRLLGAAAAMHRKFLDRPIDGLFDLAGLYRFLSPGSARQMQTDEPIPELILTGWERLFELLPDEIVSAITSVHDNPELLALALAGAPHTLIHGDFKVANLAMDARSVYLLDWGALTSWAPAAVEMAYFVAVNSAAVDASLDELLDDVRFTHSAGPDDPALPLALFGALVQLGWDKGLAATANNHLSRAREIIDLEWWVARSREALEEWSPPSS